MKGVDGADVALDERVDVLVAGLGGDSLDGHAGNRGGGGVPPARSEWQVTRSAGMPAAAARGRGIYADRCAGDRVQGDPVVGPDPGERGALRPASVWALEPMSHLRAGARLNPRLSKHAPGVPPRPAHRAALTTTPG